MLNQINHELAQNLSLSVAMAEEISDYGIGEKLLDIVFENGDGNNGIVCYTNFAKEIAEYVEFALDELNLHGDVLILLQNIKNNALNFLNDNSQRVNEKPSEEVFVVNKQEFCIPANIEA